MSDSTLHKKPGEVKPETQFKAENIGKWASKQENPFAEQNRKNEAKKRREAEQSKKAAPVVAIILGVAATLAAVVGLVILIVVLINNQPKLDDVPTIAGNTTQDIVNYQQTLQNFYNNSDKPQEEKVQEVDQFVQSTLSTGNGRRYEKEIRIAQAALYMNNGLYNDAIRVLDGVNPDGLGLDQQQMFYNILYYCYAAMGDYDKANEYTQILYEIINNLEGAGE